MNASEIEVRVENREVTLSGAISSRFEKRHAEVIAECVSGVAHVQNNLRIQGAGGLDAGGGTGASGPAGGPGGTGSTSSNARGGRRNAGADPGMDRGAVGGATGSTTSTASGEPGEAQGGNTDAGRTDRLQAADLSATTGYRRKKGTRA